MIQATYADLLRPSAKRYGHFVNKYRLAYDTSLVVGGSIVIALCAQAVIHLPFSPVPITLQTLGVLLIGALLGSKRGALCILAYLTEGVTGLPVFAGGKFGVAILLGPTGGYLLGFVVAAFVVGWLTERGWDRRYWTTVIAMISGTVLIYVFGLIWLANFVSNEMLWKAGLLPFIPGAVIKISLAAVLLPTGWKIIGIRKAVRKLD